MPVGTILPYKGAIKDIPEKWALCNGSNGTPNLSGRFLEGVTSSPGSTKSAGLPNITGSAAWAFAGFVSGGTFSGALNFNESAGRTPTLTAGKDDNRNKGAITFNASSSNSIYGASSTVQPNSYTVLYIMKIKA